MRVSKKNNILYLIKTHYLLKLIMSFMIVLLTADSVYAVSEGKKPHKYSYRDLYPEFCVIKKTNPIRVETNTLYLTFDDGPSFCTDYILKILAKKNVKATFFVVGTKDEANLTRMREIVRQGHAIGMHSYSHSYRKIYASVSAFLGDMYRDFLMIKRTTGVTPEIYRFPGGSVNCFNRRIYRRIKAEMSRRGFVAYDWNMSACDAAPNPQTPEQISANIRRQSQRINRPIILMHDSETKFTTAQALEDIIDFFIAKGYKFEKLTPDVKPIYLRDRLPRVKKKVNKATID